MSTRSMLTFPTTVERASHGLRSTQSHQTWTEGRAGGEYPVLALPGPPRVILPMPSSTTTRPTASWANMWPLFRNRYWFALERQDTKLEKKSTENSTPPSLNVSLSLKTDV